MTARQAISCRVWEEWRHPGTAVLGDGIWGDSGASWRKGLVHWPSGSPGRWDLGPQVYTGVRVWELVSAGYVGFSVQEEDTLHVGPVCMTTWALCWLLHMWVLKRHPSCVSAIYRERNWCVYFISPQIGYWLQAKEWILPVFNLVRQWVYWGHLQEQEWFRVSCITSSRYLWNVFLELFMTWKQLNMLETPLFAAILIVNITLGRGINLCEFVQFQVFPKTWELLTE